MLYISLRCYIIIAAFSRSIEMLVLHSINNIVVLILRLGIIPRLQDRFAEAQIDESANDEQTGRQQEHVLPLLARLLHIEISLQLYTQESLWPLDSHSPTSVAPRPPAI